MFNKVEYINGLLNGMDITEFAINLTFVLIGVTFLFSSHVAYSKRKNKDKIKGFNFRFFWRTSGARMITDIIGIYVIVVWGQYLYMKLFVNFPQELKLIILGMGLDGVIALLMFLAKLVKIINHEKILQELNSKI